MNAQTDAENAGQIIRRRRGQIVDMLGKKSRAGTEQPKKMLKMTIDPEMYMKTKGQTTKCPTQKATFLHSRTPFCTETDVFCRDRRLFCHSSSPGERTVRFKI